MERRGSSSRVFKVVSFHFTKHGTKLGPTHSARRRLVRGPSRRKAQALAVPCWTVFPLAPPLLWGSKYRVPAAEARALSSTSGHQRC